MLNYLLVIFIEYILIVNHDNVLLVSVSRFKLLLIRCLFNNLTTLQT